MLRERIYSFIAATMICVLCAAGGYAAARQWACDESWDGPGREAKIETAAKAAKEMGLVNEDRPTPAETVKEEPVKLVTGVLGGPQAETVKAKPETEKTSLGTFTVTFYCACPKCCGKWSNEENPLTASGARAEAGVTVGADWETLPEGTEIEIEGLGRRVVQDKPAEWIVEKYDGRIIDVFCDSHEEALKLGKQEAEVWAWD